MDSFLGFVYISALNYAPRNYLFCSGQTLAINDNTALFSLLGDQFGGDGRSTFALPDLRGRVPLGSNIMGSPVDPGVMTFPSGQRLGQSEQVLGINHLPSHTHGATYYHNGPPTVNATVTVKADDTPITATNRSSDPEGNYWAQAPTIGPNEIKTYGNQGTTTMASDAVEVSIELGNLPTPTIENAGGSNALSMYQPSTGMAFVICMQGLYPPRS